MNRSRPIVRCLCFVTVLLSCAEPVKRVSFAKNAGDQQGAQGQGPASGGTGVGSGNGSGVKGGTDLGLTRDTLAKILQAPGGEQDNICMGQDVSSKQQLRLLTRNEYMNTVKDILSVTTDYKSSLPQEVQVFGFNNNADSSQVSADSSVAYFKVALSIAAEVKPKLKTLVGCAETAGLSCAEKVIETLAPLLWRRPLEASDKTLLTNLYNTGLASSPADGMTALLSNLLMAPDFIYRMEVGKNTALTEYELASALSYFFWATSPDKALRDLAAAGTLSKADNLLAQAQRLLADKTKTKFMTAGFVEGWLNPSALLNDDKDPTVFPKLTDTIKTDMVTETIATFDVLMKDSTSTFETLFTADYSIGTSGLASYYGGQFEAATSKIKFTNQSRRGLLGWGSFLAHNATATATHPIQRGVFVQNQILCEIPLPPPDNVDLTVPMPTKNQTTRESFAAIVGNPACASCHIAIDGIGLGMEDYDGAGIYREKENNKKIDLSGELVNVDNMTTKFNGTSEMASYLGTSSQAKRCFVIEWYRYAHGYAERPDDICAIRDIANKFEKGAMTLPQLLINIVTHPSYSKKD